MMLIIWVSGLSWLPPCYLLTQKWLSPLHVSHVLLTHVFIWCVCVWTGSSIRSRRILAGQRGLRHGARLRTRWAQRCWSGRDRESQPIMSKSKILQLRSMFQFTRSWECVCVCVAHWLLFSSSLLPRYPRVLVSFHQRCNIASIVFFFL